MRAAVSCLLVVAALGAVSAVAPAQPPTFPSRVELVTVDVVVLDREGRPVRGLTRDDFTVEEDGRPQEVVSFEAYVAEAPAAAAALPSVLASNEVERPASARAFAVLVDDLGMAMQDAVETRRAVTTFLERSVRDGDEAILATTSGDVWWSARLPDGRADLLAVVARLKGRRSEISMSFDYVSDYEAFSISDRESAGGPILQRVVDRWTEAGVCITGAGGRRLESCPEMVRARARGIDGDRRARTRRLLATVRRGLAALAPVHGRKSLLLFSRGFLEDSEPQARDVVAASREAGTAVYFLNVRGLVAKPGIPSAADPAPAPDASASGALAFEDSTLDSAGARALAEDTGGFSVVNTNDLAAGAARIWEESRVFYLLGFQAPPGRPPGAWRKVHVAASRAGLTVRARRGYTVGGAAGAGARTADASAGAGNLSPVVQAALDSVEAAAGIPLRAMPYVFEPRPKGTARVVVAAEFDASRLAFEGSGTARAARLEVTVAVTQRDTGRTMYSDERVEVRVPEGVEPGWRAVARELELPAGVAQARLVVRDPASNLMGAVSHRFEVPRAAVLRLSTPIVTEHVDRGPSGHGRPRAALAAHRVFRPEGSLYCEFEVFGATRDPAGSAPRVSSGVEVRRADGGIVRQAAPTRIAVEREGRVVRLVGVGLDGMEEGAYELVLEVRDEVGGGRVERREPFTLAR